MKLIPPDLRNEFAQRIQESTSNIESLSAIHYAFTKMSMITTTQWMAQHTDDLLNELKALRDEARGGKGDMATGVSNT